MQLFSKRNFSEHISNAANMATIKNQENIKKVKGNAEKYLKKRAAQQKPFYVARIGRKK